MTEEALARAFKEAADAMVDAISANEQLAVTLLDHAADGESVEAQRLAKICLALLLAIAGGKIPHIKWAGG